MRRILIPVDFSEDSVFAIEVGVKVANKLKAKVRLMHVRTGKCYHPQFQKDNMATFLSDVEDTYMKQLLEQAQKRYTVVDGELDYRIREGNVVREIQNQAHYDDSSLIVVGTHGVSGAEDRWLGSNAYRLVANAPCAVLAVRHSMTFHGHQKILLPIDSSKVSRRIVPQVAGLASAINAELLVVGISFRSRWIIPGRVEAYVRQVDRYLKKISGIRYESCVVDGNKGPEYMLTLAHEKGATLVALPVKQDGNPFGSIFEPFANELLNISDLPLFAVPEKE
jgi:nucleotide-binding universal stress UspA family protein